MKRLLKNRSGTAEIVGTVLFLVILFFFFSNVFLWHNQVTREMDQVVADKTNSAVRIEKTVLLGIPVNSSDWRPYQYLRESKTPNGYCLVGETYTFITGVDEAEETLVADIRVSIYASYNDPYSESCFVYIKDFNQVAWVNTGLMIMNGYRWCNTTLSLPGSYIDTGGNVEIEIADASSQLGFNDTAQGTLSIASMDVCADWIALQVTNIGGSDAALSRLWIVTATDHAYRDLNDALVAGGSTRTIMFTTETTMVADDASSLVVNYAPTAGQATFRVLTTLGNNAACSIDFPD
ncbi:MAG: hypothetical protein ABSF24_05310 [Candidatus Bathyarchaeia archaeon]|jgi:hypothetical protein